MLAGDVNADDCVDDTDLASVLFDFGGPESGHFGNTDLNEDGIVDDADLALVGTYYGSWLWAYTYDEWGNLIRAESSCVATYEAGYDAFGRRVWQSIDGERTYFLYDGDTLIGEMNGAGAVVVEYLWGPFGPIARIDHQNPSNTRYYILDGLGHTRLLVDNQGHITDDYRYDSWGNRIGGLDPTPNPFRWNGAYGYEYIPQTGLYHVGAREYDPRTARWLQRDPIEVGGGDPNLYRYCLNDPINLNDPTGTDAFDTANDFVAGWGDALTFGATGLWRDFIGADDTVNENSSAYRAGSVTGAIHGVGMSAPALWRAGRALKGAYNAWRAGRGAAQAGEETMCVFRAMSRAEREAMKDAGGFVESNRPSMLGGHGMTRVARDAERLSAWITSPQAESLNFYEVLVKAIVPKSAWDSIRLIERGHEILVDVAKLNKNLIGSPREIPKWKWRFPGLW